MNKNLLILGAGQYSYVVREIAEAIGEFEKIDLLDDNNPSAIGKINDFENLQYQYSHAIVSIGSNPIRMQLLERLEAVGYLIPVLIHPRAYVSPSAKIGAGSIVEPFAVIQANATSGKGCIISATAVINHNAVVGDGAHCDCGTVTAARGVVPAGHKVKCGAVFYSSLPDEGEVRYPVNYSADIGI